MTEQRECKVVTAEPAAFGLLGLAVATLVVGAVNLGWASGTYYIVPWAFFLGALPQLIACFMEFKRGNAFGATTFGGFAVLWLGLGVTYMWQFVNAVNPDVLVAPDPVKHLGFVYIGYLVFGLYMMVGSLTMNKGMFAIFAFIVLFFLALIGESFYADLWKDWKTFVGLMALAVAIASFYVSAAVMLNNVTGREVLPMGKPFLKPEQLAVVK
jgi:succinate-acetate transporter protein